MARDASRGSALRASRFHRPELPVVIRRLRFESLEDRRLLTVSVASIWPATQPTFDLSPLQVSGSFTFDSTTQQYEATGAVEIGLVPGSGETFTPLLQETGGTFDYSAQTITASGDFAALVGGLTSNLFSGSLTINVGTAATSSMTVTADVQLAGLATTFTGLTFAPGAGGSTTNSQLDLTGGFTLPSQLGGFAVPIGPAAPFVVSSSGFGLATGRIGVPDQTFELDSLLDVSAKDMSFQYTSAMQELQIQGDFSIGVKSGASVINLLLGLSGSNAIDYAPASGLTVDATLNYEGPASQPLFGNWFTVSGATISVDSAASQVGGSLIMDAAGQQFTGAISFAGGELNSVALSGTALAIPVGLPGLYLQSISGTLTDLAPSDPTEATITGNLGVSYQALFTASVAATVQLDAQNDVDVINGQATVNVASAAGPVTGSATFNDNLVTDQFALTSVSLTGFHGSLTFSGALTGSSSGALTGYGTGTFAFSGSTGGGSVTGTVVAYISPSSDKSQSYFDASTQFTVLVASESIGVRYSLDGTVSVLGAASLAAVPAVAAPAAGTSAAVTPDVSASQGFTVAAGASLILLSASWTDAASSVPFQITSPTGSIYTSSGLGLDTPVSISGLSGSTALTFAVIDPTPGTWQLALTNTANLGTVQLNGYVPTTNPTVQVTSLATGTGANLIIHY